ncbi:MAG: PAS domain-containing sensor histidine kinase [Alphaproteobacteria bacterium]
MVGTKITLPPLTRSLSARLLVLTVAFVMVGEVLIYVPSIARYRLVYLEERLAAGHQASLAVEAAPDGVVTPGLERELLLHARVRSIALMRPDAAYFVLGEMPESVDAGFDLDKATPVTLIREAFVTLAHPEGRLIRVMGPARLDPRVGVDITMDEAPMRAEMLDYSRRILILSIVLSLMTAALVYLSLHWLMVRPMRRMTESMVAFRETPEDASSGITVTGRSDEIGVAQRELARMQRGLRAALGQRRHLAALGAGVSKINHDLRNILSTAVLVSDRLAHSGDPEVQRQTPTLMNAINRAVALCEATLRFARPDESEPAKSSLALAPLVDEVGNALALPTDGDVAWRNEVDSAIEVNADRDQIFRVLLNLARNAVEAIDGPGEVRIAARRSTHAVEVEVADSGPGLPPAAREHLFEPFTGSARPGGVGLGLAISRELVRGHGGDLTLIKSDASGTTFRLSLPAGEARRGAGGRSKSRSSRRVGHLR